MIKLPFQDWFSLKVLSAGDWPFLFDENIREFSFLPEIRQGVYFPLDFYYQSTAKILYFLGSSWVLIERLAWFWPFLFLTIFSAWYLAKTVFPKQKIAHLLAPFIYLLNTYILMIVGGGQMGIALAYSLGPLVLAKFIELNQKQKLRFKLITGLILALQIMFDLRIALLTMLAILLYAVIVNLRSLKFFVLPFLLALFLHSFWLLPAYSQNKLSLPATYNESGWVSFLSFTDFPQAISLLHPNWPENVFGKTYLMKAEFLVLPILAFVSLLWLDRRIIFLVLLALISVFLAKGSNQPFGSFYIWLFNYFPGMNLFRDASKFYSLTALSYSLLIPFSVIKISSKLKSIFAKFFLLIVIGFLLFLIKPLFLNQLTGTFQAKAVPNDYLVFKEFISQQPGPFRILWVPAWQRFGLSSDQYRAIASANYIEDRKCLEPFCSLKIAEYDRDYFQCHSNEKCFPADASFLANPQVVGVLKDLTVKYVVIPDDSEEEIFFYERQYDPEARQKLEEFLNSISWLKKLEVTNKIAVYELISN